MDIRPLELAHLEKFCILNNIDISHVDETLTYRENKSNLEKLFPIEKEPEKVYDKDFAEYVDEQIRLRDAEEEIKEMKKYGEEYTEIESDDTEWNRTMQFFEEKQKRENRKRTKKIVDDMISRLLEENDQKRTRTDELVSVQEEEIIQPLDDGIKLFSQFKTLFKEILVMGVYLTGVLFLTTFLIGFFSGFFSL